jgi:carboxylesterase type B
LDNILMMGHSAGAANVASLLFLPDVLPKDDPLRKRIKAAVLASAPFDNSAITMEWVKGLTVAQYWGDLDLAKANDPVRLFQKLDDELVAALPEMLMVEAENEPQMLLDGADVFHKEVKKRTGKDLQVIVGKKHNHISLMWAICSGEGEEWAGEVAEWLAKFRIAY